MRQPSVQALIVLSLAPLVLFSDGGGRSALAQIQSQGPYPGKAWPRLSASEQAGWSREKLAAAREYANADSIHTSAVVIVRGGEVVDQWGDIDKKISSYSVRKSLLSALYGIYAAEGVIDINQTLEQLGIDDSPDPLTREEKQARIVDLLRARSGVYHAVDFDVGGYEYLWWVDHGGVHFPEVSLPGIFSARGSGAHYIFVIPSLDMVIVHRTDNDPPVKDAKTIAELADRTSVSQDRAQFGHLMKLILDARTVTRP